MTRNKQPGGRKQSTAHKGAGNLGKRKAFYDALDDLFCPAQPEGVSGFVDLMRYKSTYYKKVREEISTRIDELVSGEEAHPGFSSDMYEQLYAFFSRYFCESGSVYFRHIPRWQPAWERAYTDGGDIDMVWKTRDMYYVKSDYIIESMRVDLPDVGTPFYFDASEIEARSNNERRQFVFEYAGSKKVKDAGKKDVKCAVIKVSFPKNGAKSDYSTMTEAAREEFQFFNESTMRSACAVFTRRGEVDFFVRRNTEKFLWEQWQIFICRHMTLDGKTLHSQERLRHLEKWSVAAKCVVDFIAQFEDELALVWEKPKFVRNACYVITLDRLTADVLKKIANHKGAKTQLAEWKTLEIVSGKKINDIMPSKGKVPNEFKFLPLDTAHFVDIENEILECLGNLDEVLDGELVKSENWQALNTLGAKYRGQVKCTYIDPPFNLDSSDQFAYRTNYKDSCWATMLQNRLELVRNFLPEDGSIFVRCDHNGNWIVRSLMDSIFGKDYFLNQIALGKSAKITEGITKYHSDYDSLFFYGHPDKHAFRAVEIKRATRKWQPMHLGGVRHSPVPEKYVKLYSPDNLQQEAGKYKTRARVIMGKEMLPPEGRHWAISQAAIFESEKKGEIKIGGNGDPMSLQSEYQKLTDNWTDKVGYARNWDFLTENHEVVLSRAMNTASSPGDIVMDFFSGSGTTMAVSQKLARKWVGVEMGDHFNTVILPRMKKVLAGEDRSGISKDVKYQGGGAFVYYELEQYEDTLKTMKYADGDLLDSPATSPSGEYVFLTDEKCAQAVEVSGKNGKSEVKLTLSHLYKDISLPETLANALGTPLRRKKDGVAEFADGTVIKTDISSGKMSRKDTMRLLEILRPYLWWGRS